MTWMKSPTGLDRVGIGGRELVADADGVFDCRTLDTDQIAFLKKRLKFFGVTAPSAELTEDQRASKDAEAALLASHQESLRVLDELKAKSDDELRAQFVELRPGEALPPDADHDTLAGLVHGALALAGGEPAGEQVAAHVNPADGAGDVAGASNGAAATHTAPNPAAGAQDGSKAVPAGSTATGSTGPTGATGGAPVTARKKRGGSTFSQET